MKGIAGSPRRAGARHVMAGAPTTSGRPAKCLTYPLAHVDSVVAGTSTMRAASATVYRGTSNLSRSSTSNTHLRSPLVIQAPGNDDNGHDETGNRRAPSHGEDTRSESPCPASEHATSPINNRSASRPGSRARPSGLRASGPRKTPGGATHQCHDSPCGRFTPGRPFTGFELEVRLEVPRERSRRRHPRSAAELGHGGRSLRSRHRRHAPRTPAGARRVGERRPIRRQERHSAARRQSAPRGRRSCRS